MRITDSLILSIIDQHGALTTGQIDREIIARYPDMDRQTVYSDVPHRVRQLIRYRIIEPIQHKELTYYRRVGSDAQIVPDPKRAPCYRIREYIQELPEGSVFTYTEIENRFNVSRTVPEKVIKSIPGIYKLCARPCLFIKGASQ